MNDLAIWVEGLGKRYRIGAREQRYTTLREAISSLALKPLRKLSSLRSERSEADSIWAVKDVSFEVEKGEVVGLIGRNGAGKSTLLKILSGITEPTEGRAEIHGRVGSLLEVGTGFHPELTGRENIFLNGAILGMKRVEIEKNFDEIVSFAEVDRFIDTPVKRYSSGMYLRLAFAVAAHMETEILLIDEVLAVGDIQFQKKCLGKMGEVAGNGRTVLFVSHNMSAVKSLCSRAILVGNGSLLYSGNVSEAVDRYMTDGSEMAETGVIPDSFTRQGGTGEARFRKVEIQTKEGFVTNQLYYRQKVSVNVHFEVLKEIKDGILSVGIATTDGTIIVYLESMDVDNQLLNLPPGEHSISVDLPINLLPGTYTVSLGMNHLNGKTIDWIERARDFTVIKASLEKDRHYRWAVSHGFVNSQANWNIPANLRA
jgi:lipopolysaccharide transport system ATP-binding protein